MNEIIFSICVIVGITLCILGVGSLIILLWIHMYIKFLKKPMQDIKVKKIKKKISKFKDMDLDLLPDKKKSVIKNKINKYTEFIDSIKVIEYDGLSITDIKISERLKKMIDDMIMVECYSTLRQYITINTKYPITNLDTDISKISTNVFNGLNIKVSNTTMVFSKEYLMNYIIGQTFNLILKLAVDHNASILS